MLQGKLSYFEKLTGEDYCDIIVTISEFYVLCDALS